MLRNRSRSTGSLLLAGLAAYAYYKYSKMSPDERRRLFSGIKEKGKKLVDDYVPADIQNKFLKKDNVDNHYNFGDGSGYTG